MTNDQWVVLEKAYNDLIKCFKSADAWHAVNIVQIHKQLAELERDLEITREAKYYKEEKCKR